jgi:hypothetical protein
MAVYGRQVCLGRVWRLLLALCTCSAAALLLAAPRARADETLVACGLSPNNVFAPSTAAGFYLTQSCGVPNAQLSIAPASTTGGARAFWAADAPSGLLIDQATASSVDAYGINTSGSGYGGGYFWGPDGSDGATVSETNQLAGPFSASAGDAGFPSSDFGFQIVCDNANTCTASASFSLSQLTLSVAETSGPSISAGALWDQSGWVRGSWPITANGDSPSGVCSLSASISGDPAGVSASFAANQTVWHQCDAIGAGGLSGALNTALAANGADTLSVSDADAAGLSNAASKTIDVDNQAPTVSLSGPATALSSAGTQEVAVSVGAGPSGAYGANCSVDGGQSSFYAGASSQVAVSGVGEHTVTCTGMSNAISSAGVRASSPSETFSLDIQQPTEEAISFSKIADAVHCARVLRRVKVLGRAHIVRLHGHPVSVRRVHYVRRRVRRCFAPTVRRRVLVVLERHGKAVRRHGHVVRVRQVRRVVLVPHRVYRAVREIHHGRGSTVSGLLLLSDGTPVAGQTITILGAPNVGTSLQFAAVSSAVTNADGYWVARIPAGPSRILEAQYGGTSTTAPASSETVKLRVPARLRILSHTERVAWGETVRFTGQLYGGEIPPGGVNLELRYGYGKASTTYGVKTHVEGDGRFQTAFTFGPGDPRDHLRFHFKFGTLPGGAYPWAPAFSNIADVEVGGHPHAHHHHRAHRRQQHHR